MAGSKQLGPIVVCVDGSDASTRAVAAGLDVVGRDAPVIVVTVAEDADPMLVTGGGFAGGVMSQEELDAQNRQAESEAQAIAEDAVKALGLADAEVRVVRGQAGAALCELAATLPARAVVMGSRGRGGLKRALLGSVSDFVVRNAPCPVVITTPDD